jgi:hypothetical protein
MLTDVGAVETFSPDEVRALAPYFTNTDRPVFALRGLPEAVKGALFARYSRSAKSLRRLFLDEFLDHVAAVSSAPLEAASRAVKEDRADKLYARVFGEFGDDSPERQKRGLPGRLSLLFPICDLHRPHRAL